ncbi:GTP-binding protein Rho1 [Recurvomyces mirabilis]|nr:GTP-binding protein Rho1 [Recurvomyces mirabilis]
MDNFPQHHKITTVRNLMRPVQKAIKEVISKSPVYLEAMRQAEGTDPAVSGPAANVPDPVPRSAVFKSASEDPTPDYKRKVVVVGDSAVGKTALLMRLINDTYTDEIDPTIDDVYRINVKTNGQVVELTLIETSGFTDYDALRATSYPGASLILICFSVNWAESYQNVLGKWSSEVSRNCPNSPIILVGLQADRRDPSKGWMNNEVPITSEKAISLQKQIGASEYLECSAKFNQNVQEVFVAAARYAISATAVPPPLPLPTNRGTDSESTVIHPTSLATPIKAIGPPEIRRKLVAVGDGAIGKTALLLTFSRGYFDFENYSQGTVFDNYVADVKVNGRHVELALWDTAGVEDYDRLRPLSYPDSHVVLICFSIGRPASYENITEKWAKEILQFCPGLPIVLVGLQKDVRYDPQVLAELAKTGEYPVTPQQGEDLRKAIAAAKYFECSSKTKEGVREVFEYATRSALQYRPKEKKQGFRALFKR